MVLLERVSNCTFSDWQKSSACLNITWGLLICTGDAVHIRPRWSVWLVVWLRHVGICRTMRACHWSHADCNLVSPRRHRLCLAQTVNDANDVTDDGNKIFQLCALTEASILYTVHLLLGLHTYTVWEPSVSVAASVVCCLPSVCLSRIRSRKLHKIGPTREISSPL